MAAEHPSNSPKIDMWATITPIWNLARKAPTPMEALKQLEELEKIMPKPEDVHEDDKESYDDLLSEMAGLRTRANSADFTPRDD